MGCRVQQGSITTAIAAAVRAGDRELMGHLAALIEEGGIYTDDFKTQIVHHPEGPLER